jgi:pyruvate formate lyase activating enzyme
MLLGGFQKMTLIDYPGKIATTVFTAGCNFRCPFCHNPELVELDPEDMPIFREQEEKFFTFLEGRKGLLDGVCITGGEPTVQADIIPFMRKLKDMGFLVKLDSNGTNPDILAQVFDEGLADYIAMDIKNGPERYHEAVGTAVDMDRIRESIRLIMDSRVDYEFRTTVVPGIHTEEDFEEVAKLIDGAKRYYIQVFRDGKVLSPGDTRFKAKVPDPKKIRDIVAPHVGEIGIRE